MYLLLHSKIHFFCTANLIVKSVKANQENWKEILSPTSRLVFQTKYFELNSVVRMTMSKVEKCNNAIAGKAPFFHQ